MALTQLDHYLLQTEDLEATRDWYIQILGMKEGPHPDFGFPVCWLYVNDKSVLHLSKGGRDVSENRLRYLGQESQATTGTGVIDHIAYAATGLKETLDHLDANAVEYASRQASAEGGFQLFIKGPDGVKIELNFDASEAVDLEPALRVSGLLNDL